MGQNNCCFRSDIKDPELETEKGRSLGIIDHDRS